MKIYVDWPWSDDVVYYGAPLRAYVHTERWTYIIGARSQRWDPEFGWSSPLDSDLIKFKFITRHPHREFTCQALLEDKVICPRLAGHEGRHWNWKRGWKQSASLAQRQSSGLLNRTL